MDRIHSRFCFRLAATWLLATTGCSNNTTTTKPSLPSLHDITDAPAPIQVAARSVVRIGTAGAMATGSFISATGLLLTNNHVLGAAVCAREGCWVQLAPMHQNGTPWQAPARL
jgi:S1-C subfamily serine protease